jgi:hypothetical protein
MLGYPRDFRFLLSDDGELSGAVCYPGLSGRSSCIHLIYQGRPERRSPCHHRPPLKPLFRYWNVGPPTYSSGHRHTPSIRNQLLSSPQFRPNLLVDFVTPIFTAHPWIFILLSCGRIFLIPLFFVFVRCLGSSDNNPDPAMAMATYY